MGSPSAPLIQATSDFAKNGDPNHTPPLPPKTWQPSPPLLLLPRLANLICLPVRGHSLLRSPDFRPRPLGTAGGEGEADQGAFAKVPLRALALGGGAPGFSLGLRSGRSIPPAQPRVAGCGRLARSGLTQAARGPLLKSWDPTQRGATPREPQLWAHRHPPPSCSG